MEPLSLIVPVLTALVAVGAVLFIKIERRRSATRSDTLDGLVPARPLSEADPRRMGRNYVLVALLIVALTFAATVLVATSP